MARFRWQGAKRGKLHIKGTAPRPDPHDPKRVIAGSPAKMLVFCPDGEDGIYDTEDPAEIAALRTSLPAKRGWLTGKGTPRAPAPRARPGGVASMAAGTIERVLSAALPYFEEPEPFAEVLAVVGHG